MRSLLLETKFQKMCRFSGSGSPPRIMSRAAPDAFKHDLGARLEHDQLVLGEAARLAFDLDLAADDIGGALDVLRADLEAGAVDQGYVGVEQIGKGAGGRTQTVQRTRQQPQRRAVAVGLGQAFRSEVLEAGLGFFVRDRQRDPALEAEHRASRRAHRRAAALGVDDAAPRRHEVDLARVDRLHVSFAVPMHDLAFDQIGQRGQADMRMGAGIEPLPRAEGDRTEAVQEDERPHGPPLRGRQRSADQKTVAEIPDVRQQYLFDRSAVRLHRHQVILRVVFRWLRCKSGCLSRKLAYVRTKHSRKSI